MDFTDVKFAGVRPMAFWQRQTFLLVLIIFVSCDRPEKGGGSGDAEGRSLSASSEMTQNSSSEMTQKGGDASVEDKGKSELGASAEALSKDAAVKKYPSLGVLDSPFNKSFRERVGVLKRTQPRFFADPRWPERLADEVAATEGRLGAEIGNTSVPSDAVLEVDEIRRNTSLHVGRYRNVKGVIRKISDFDSPWEVIRFRLVGDLDVVVSRHEFPQIRGVRLELLRPRVRVESGHLMFKEGPRDVVLLSEGASVWVGGNVVVKGNRLFLEKAQLR